MRENEMKTTTKFFRKKPKPNQIRRQNEPIEQRTGITRKKTQGPNERKKGKRIPTQGSHYLINYN